MKSKIKQPKGCKEKVLNRLGFENYEDGFVSYKINGVRSIKGEVDAMDLNEAIELTIKYRNAEVRKEFEKLQRWNLCLLGGKPAMKKAKKGYFIDYYELLNKMGGKDD